MSGEESEFERVKEYARQITEQVLAGFVKKDDLEQIKKDWEQRIMEAVNTAVNQNIWGQLDPEKMRELIDLFTKLAGYLTYPMKVIETMMQQNEKLAEMNKALLFLVSAETMGKYSEAFKNGFPFPMPESNIPTPPPQVQSLTPEEAESQPGHPLCYKPQWISCASFIKFENPNPDGPVGICEGTPCKYHEKKEN